MDLRKFAAFSIATVLLFASSVSKGDEPMKAPSPTSADRTSQQLSLAAVSLAKQREERSSWLVQAGSSAAEAKQCKVDSDCPAKHRCCSKSDGSTFCGTACKAD
jgi:hypothetical protein